MKTFGIIVLFGLGICYGAQITGAPVVVAGWNATDPANHADGRPAALTHLGVLWNAIVGPDGSIVFAEGSLLRKIADDNTIRTLATDSRLGSFTKLAEDRLGNIFYITESEIYKFGIDGNTTRVAGGRKALAQAGMAATDAIIFPQGLAVDVNGNLLISDNQTVHVWRVDSTGVLRLVAGTGIAGTAGEGGPATQAQIQFPLDLGFNAAGELYINDGGRFVKIRQDGTLVRVSPPGVNLASRNSVVDPSGTIYYVGPLAFQISRLTPDGVSTVIAGDGNLGTTNGCGSASDPATGDAKTAQFQSMVGLALDTAGNLIVAEESVYYSRIRMVTIAGRIRTLAGGPPSFGGDGGPATSAYLSNPRSAAFAPDGALYIADTGNHRIRRITTAGVIQTVVGQSDPTGDMLYSCSGATADSLHSPEAVAVDAAGNLYIADTGNNRVLKVTPAGLQMRFAGTGAAGYVVAGAGAHADSVPLSSPHAVAIDAAGYIWIGDGLARTLKVSPDGTIADILPRLRADALASDPAGNVFVSSQAAAYRITANDQLVAAAGLGPAPEISPSGAPPIEITDIPPNQTTSAATRDTSGNVYFQSTGGIEVISPACTAVKIPPTATFPSRGNAAAGPHGEVYLVDDSTSVVWKLLALTSSASDLPNPQIAPGAPVQNAANLVVASVDSTMPIGSGQSAPVRTLQSDAVAPGEIIHIYGQCLGPMDPVQASYDSSGQLPTMLGGVQVKIAGTPVPLVSVQQGLIVAVTPFNLATTQASSATLTFNGASASFSVTGAAARPGLARYLEIDGSSTALALNQDGSINSQQHPAPVGSVISLFGTGFGQTNPASADGRSASNIAVRYLSDVQVTIGGATAPVWYVGVAPGFVGLTQLNVAIPAVASGARKVQIAMTGAPFRQVVQVWVK